eukprot:357806-Chlamydomonas_euryale.AAC.11
MQDAHVMTCLDDLQHLKCNQCHRGLIQRAVRLHRSVSGKQQHAMFMPHGPVHATLTTCSIPAPYRQVIPKLQDHAHLNKLLQVAAGAQLGHYLYAGTVLEAFEQPNHARAALQAL